LALRSRIVLAAADGANNQQIAAELKIPTVTVGKWRRSFAIDGLEGLRDAPRSGRPLKHDADTRHKVQTRVCQQPEDQSRWTVRTLAAELELPASTVHAMLRAAKLRPHRIRTFTFSPDPDFEAKLLDIVGLYLNPPENALVLCVDEKPSIQALARTQPLLPLGAKQIRAWTNEICAAWHADALGRPGNRHRQNSCTCPGPPDDGRLLEFHGDVVKSYPLGELHVVLDNLNIHKNEAAQQWLLRHPRVHFHYTPTHASWMNMIECFFSILTRQALTQSVQRSKKELKDFLLLYLKKYRQNPTPFTWTKGPEHSNASSKQRNRTRLLIPSKQSNGRPKKNTINN
jgi:transposase